MKKSLLKNYDWNYPEIEWFPKTIQVAFRNFKTHCKELTIEGYASADYIAALQKIDEKMGKWLNCKCDINWKGDPSDANYVLSAMGFCVEQFLTSAQKEKKSVTENETERRIS
jgi:hypothetical protein